MGKLENEQNSMIGDHTQSLNYFYSSIDKNSPPDAVEVSVATGASEPNGSIEPDENFEDAQSSVGLDRQSTDDDFDLDDGCLEPFQHQVGGHGSVLSWDQCTVCKPLSSREQKFYEILPLEFKEFVPEYRGVVEIGLIEQNGGTLLLNANPAAKEENAINSDQKNLAPPSGKSLDKRGSMRKCESSNSLTKCRSIGRIRAKRSGSLELEIFARKHGKFNGASPAGPKKSFRDSQLFNDAHEATKSGLYPQNPWALQCQTRQLTKMHRKMGEKQKFLMLENLVCNFNLPCVLDLKMGYRQYGDDASPAKRDSQAKKCRNSTSAVLGVRMCGMQVYHADSGVFKCSNKYYGRALSVDGFKREIFKFWHNGLNFRSDLLPACIEKLKALKELISLADGYRFYSSSLLIIYEGDSAPNAPSIPSKTRPATTSASTLQSLVDVRMIDFEHNTCPYFIHAKNDPAHKGHDKGYVEGVANLIAILCSLIDDQSAKSLGVEEQLAQTSVDLVDQSANAVCPTGDQSDSSCLISRDQQDVERSAQNQSKTLDLTISRLQIGALPTVFQIDQSTTPAL